MFNICKYLWGGVLEEEKMLHGLDCNTLCEILLKTMEILSQV
jgi:hypothetical protein